MADPFSFALATVAQIGISYLFPSEGPRLKDLKISASTYGAAIPWVFGQTRVPGNMIWSMPIKEHKKKSFAGKGGFANQYTYSCTFAMGLCKGPIKQVRKVWADGKLIYDITSGTVASSKYRMRFYLGDENQVPDSAIVADLGDNAVPFRGLAYILFDSMALADFGNRIPQITTEVLVGSSEPTVEASQITEPDGTTPIATTFAAGELVLDAQRRLGYLRVDTTLRQFSTRTGFAVQEFTSTAMAFDGGDTLSALLTGGHDGAVFVTRGPAGATVKVDRLDPFSLQSVASHASVPSPALAICARDSNSTEFLLTVSATGDACLFKALDLTQRWAVPLGGTANVGPFRACGRDADTSGQPTFYVLMSQPGASDLVLAKVQGADAGTGPTIDEVHVITGSSVTPRGIAWDSAGSAAILFWMDGAQAYIAKWSEDSGEEVWRTPIAGCPTLFSGQSVLLSDQLGWVYNGRLYVINTTTGEMIDKPVDPASGDYVNPNLHQIDWADYLVRYPDVKSEYFISGFTASASPEGYAEWHYQNFGAYEGRTLTYIGDGQGSGYALTGAFTGLSATLQAYDSTRGILVCLNGLDALINLTDTANGVSVGTIVARLLTEGGVPAAMTDLQALNTMPIRGYGWASGTDIKNILDELRRLFLFDLVERDGVLVAISRGDPTNGLPTANEVILQGALGSSSLDAVDFWQETRMQEADIPAQVTLAYMNIEADFEASTARSARISNPIPTMFSRQQVAMEINVVLTPAEAKTQVNKILYSQWLERTQHTTRLPWAYLDLDPADVIEVHMDDGRIYQDRIHQTEVGADFSLAVETYSADEGAYDLPTVTADGGSGAGGQVIADVGAALPFVINTPLLRDQDDQGGAVSLYYVGVGNASASQFRGAGLFRSLNNIDYDLLSSRDSDVEWGTVLGVTPFAVDGAVRARLEDQDHDHAVGGLVRHRIDHRRRPLDGRQRLSGGRRGHPVPRCDPEPERDLDDLEPAARPARHRVRLRPPRGGRAFHLPRERHHRLGRRPHDRQQPAALLQGRRHRPERAGSGRQDDQLPPA
jgi:hypothetical protein